LTSTYLLPLLVHAVGLHTCNAFFREECATEPPRWVRIPQRTFTEIVVTA